MAASEMSGSEVIDPLIGLIGPSLFPRTIKASADVPVPSAPKDLDSIHNFMKSLELRSPEKCMNEAKRIVDGGAELLESSLSTFSGSLGISDAIAAKVKGMPREQRPGLGLARKRAPLALRPIQSQPSVIVESAVDLDSIVDPDEYFDAYEKMERAKKEIQKQLGISVDKVDLYRQTNNARPHRKGIIGRKYSLNHCYPLASVENDDPLLSSQETVDQAMPSARKANSQGFSVHEDPNPDGDLEEVELTGSMKKTESKVSDILHELLSCNLEDLEGDGALNLLQDRLKIKPLDRENLRMPELPDFGRTTLSTVSERFRKSGRSSLVIDNVIKNLNKKSSMEHEQVVSPCHNHESSPTPPRSPFASISILRKKILQPNPISDPFSPVDTEFLECKNASASEPEDQLPGKVALNDLGMPSELESHVDVGHVEPLDLDMDAREVMKNTEVLPMQSVDENASVQNAHADSRPIEKPGNENVLNPSVFEEETMDKTDVLPMQSVDENASVQNAHADSRPIEEHDNENVLNPSVFEEVTMDNTSSIRQTDPEPHPEVHHEVTPTKRKGVAGRKRIRKAHPKRKSPEGGLDFSVFEEETRDETSGRRQTDPEPQPEVHHEVTPTKRKGVAGRKRIRKARPKRKSPEGGLDFSVFEEETRDETSGRRQTDPEPQPEVCQEATPLKRKREAGGKRIRQAHPMTRNLQDAGTSFEDGVRKSKRIRSRPLAFWKGERFVFGRVDDSVQLLGVKYISPGMDNHNLRKMDDRNLKVKPYGLVESSAFKKKLEFKALH